MTVYLQPLNLYAAKPEHSVFRDHAKIQKGYEYAAKYLGQKTAPVAERTFSQPKINLANAPTVLQFHWHPYQPTFMQSLASMFAGPTHNTTIVNNIFGDAAARAPRPLTGAERAAAKEDKQEKKIEKQASTAQTTGITLLVLFIFGIGVEYVNLNRARKNDNLALQWKRDADAEANYLGSWAGANEHAESLREFATRFSNLTYSDKRARITNVIHLTIGVVGAALLAAGGKFIIPKMMTAGWLVTTAVAAVAVLRFGMWCASTDEDNREDAERMLVLHKQLSAVNTEDRLVYCYKEGQTPYWTQDKHAAEFARNHQRAVQEQLSHEQYRARVNQSFEQFSSVSPVGAAALLPAGHATLGFAPNAEEHMRRPPYNPASPYGSLLNTRVSATESVDGSDVPPPSHI